MYHINYSLGPKELGPVIETVEEENSPEKTTSRGRVVRLPHRYVQTRFSLN